MGIVPGMHPPPSVDHINEFKDLDVPADVHLVVTPPSTFLHRPVPKDNHWAIFWNISRSTDGVMRRRLLQIVQERLGDGYANHLTNWGPITTSAGGPTPESRKFFIKTMTLSERKSLEAIAQTEEVLMPDGVWNCQDWIEAVLDKAVNGGMIAAETVADLKIKAREVIGKPFHP
ncbi:hypothetical protein SCP_0510410 [Sparassis crispa]|uniref:Uncharacterized protein n=1 Tax=Sparassis crispa TaxID=139825 RepID=A0A401GP51_9APHY|nr:hypothetical protein SCP_0510410 [Sparassis crispa]GBE83982.1 hypothetical protein SCP_0510410 [Sparassis crispa]